MVNATKMDFSLLKIKNLLIMNSHMNSKEKVCWVRDWIGSLELNWIQYIHTKSAVYNFHSATNSEGTYPRDSGNELYTQQLE